MGSVDWMREGGRAGAEWLKVRVSVKNRRYHILHDASRPPPPPQPLCHTCTTTCAQADSAGRDSVAVLVPMQMPGVVPVLKLVFCSRAWQGLVNSHCVNILLPSTPFLELPACLPFQQVLREGEKEGGWEGEKGREGGERFCTLR